MLLGALDEVTPLSPSEVPGNAEPGYLWQALKLTFAKSLPCYVPETELILLKWRAVSKIGRRQQM